MASVQLSLLQNGDLNEILFMDRLIRGLIEWSLSVPRMTRAEAASVIG